MIQEDIDQDIVDGSLLKSHPLFSEKPNALQIVVYTDEIEICNPLGSFTSKNKLLMVYYTLANINPEYRSKLASISLLAIARSVDLHQCGVNVILSRFKEDMDALYSGVKMQTIDGRKLFMVPWSLSVATLWHSMNWQGSRRVWDVPIVNADAVSVLLKTCRSDFNEDAFSKRTLKRHIKQTNLLRNSLRTTYGINRRSKLVEFPVLDITQQTPACNSGGYSSFGNQECVAPSCSVRHDRSGLCEFRYSGFPLFPSGRERSSIPDFTGYINVK